MAGGFWRTVVALTALGFQAVGDEPLSTRIESVIKSPGYQSGHWGLLVVDGKSGKTVYERNADDLFCPASVTKLFTTAAALADLGADHRFQTPVVRRGELGKDGVLKGDLILVAQGDLCLGGRTGKDGTLLFENDDHTYSDGNPRSALVASDPLAGLDHLVVREVLASGVKTVTGEILIDDRLFSPATSTGSGPSRLSPIVVNDNVIDVVATPAAKAGERADVALVPRSSYATADILVETVEEGKPVVLEVHHAGPRRFTVRGKVPVGHKPVVRIYEIEEPASFVCMLFIETLRNRGVRVEASALAENPADKLPSWSAVAKLPRVAEYTSPPLREYVKVILKVSHNLHASTLPLLVAAHHGDATLAEGLAGEGMLLKGLGVDPSAVSFGGGAGGARADLASPRATVALLRAMAARPDFAAYEAALPILGRDGTLARAVAPESPARGHARAKTGTYWVDNDLDGKAILTSKALAGYMETASGRTLVFAFFVNNVPLDVSGAKISDATASAGRLLGKLCETLYTSDVSPPPPSKAEATATGN